MTKTGSRRRDLVRVLRYGYGSLEAYAIHLRFDPAKETGARRIDELGRERGWMETADVGLAG